MEKRINWTSIFLTILALAIVYVVGTTFFTIELERLVERTITPHIEASQEVESLSREIYSGIDKFMVSRNVRVVGYTCVVVMILLAMIGLVTEKKWLASLGSIGFILPIFAYFMLHMSFLAGLGILTVLWTPFWGELVKLGDIAYLPYIILVYPFSLLDLDIRRFIAGFFASLGLLIFTLGVLAWFYARWQKKNTANFWIYRFSRHPQYLGWIIWSYGLMLRVAHRHDTALQNVNPGASLPWVIATLIIICVALSEEIAMRRQYGQGYEEYRNQAPFMFPLPGFLSKAISASFKLILRKERPETRWDLVWTFFIYLTIVMLLSLPFVLLDWPAMGWMNWPF
jgi:protein-S-isoprenylcysteine O-methyltransferase Ste14